MKQTPIGDLDSIKQKPKFVEWVPWIGKNTAQAIYPYVYLPRAIYDDIHSQRPSPYSVALVLHEQEHLKRAKDYGVLRWYIHLTSRKFRLREELAAGRPQLAYIKQQGLTFNLERRARLLAGWLYLWSGNYHKILQELKETWAAL